MTATSLDVDRVRRALHRLAQKYPNHDTALGGPHCGCDGDATEFMAAYDMEADPGGNPLPTTDKDDPDPRPRRIPEDG